MSESTRYILPDGLPYDFPVRLFIISWDELVVAIMLASTEQHTLPRRMWSGIRELLSPTIMAVATMLIIISIILMVVMELLRRRSERLRGIRN